MLILILLVAALMLTLLALADFPRGCRPHFTCVALWSRRIRGGLETRTGSRPKPTPRAPLRAVFNIRR
jgi:hypothetical protein